MVLLGEYNKQKLIKQHWKMMRFDLEKERIGKTRVVSSNALSIYDWLKRTTMSCDEFLGPHVAIGRTYFLCVRTHRRSFELSIFNYDQLFSWPSIIFGFRFLFDNFLFIKNLGHRWYSVGRTGMECQSSS